MYTQNVSIPPDYFTWRSAVPSRLDNELYCREENATNDQETTGNFKNMNSNYGQHRIHTYYSEEREQ